MADLPGAKSDEASPSDEATPRLRARLGSRRVIVPLLFVVVSSIMAFGVGEIAVRTMGHVDQDGAFWFREAAIPTLPLPVRRTREMIDEYLANPGSYLQWDADLGWSPRPGACSRDGRYCANSAGIRSDREFDLVPADGVVRVAFFGDSFMHSSDVALKDSLAVRLDEGLASTGLHAEVLNFGVDAYGFDQAYLRYLRDGVRYRPEIVVFGLQLENVARDGSIFRPLCYPSTRIPFSKPRFVLDDGKLTVVNQPTIEPTTVSYALENIDRHPLREYEFFLGDYRDRWYSRSRLISTAVQLLGRKSGLVHGAQNSLDPHGEPMEVTLAILDSVRAQTSRRSQGLVFIYLPLAKSLRERAAGRGDPMEPLLRIVRDRFDVLDPTPELLDGIRSKGFRSIIRAHYGPDGNAIVASVLARRIVEMERRRQSS